MRDIGGCRGKCPLPPALAPRSSSRGFPKTCRQDNPLFASRKWRISPLALPAAVWLLCSREFCFWRRMGFGGDEGIFYPSLFISRFSFSHFSSSRGQFAPKGRRGCFHWMTRASAGQISGKRGEPELDDPTVRLLWRRGEMGIPSPAYRSHLLREAMCHAKGRFGVSGGGTPISRTDIIVGANSSFRQWSTLAWAGAYGRGNFSRSKINAD